MTVLVLKVFFAHRAGDGGRVAPASNESAALLGLVGRLADALPWLATAPYKFGHADRPAHADFTDENIAKQYRAIIELLASRHLTTSGHVSA